MAQGGHIETKIQHKNYVANYFSPLFFMHNGVQVIILFRTNSWLLHIQCSNFSDLGSMLYRAQIEQLLYEYGKLEKLTNFIIQTNNGFGDFLFFISTHIYLFPQLFPQC